MWCVMSSTGLYGWGETEGGLQCLLPTGKHGGGCLTTLARVVRCGDCSAWSYNGQAVSGYFTGAGAPWGADPVPSLCSHNPR